MQSTPIGPRLDDKRMLNRFLLFLVTLLLIANIFSQFGLTSCFQKVDELDEFFDAPEVAFTTATSSPFLEQQGLPKISNRMLPKKLFVIYGLESSGTTFMARTIGIAVGVPPKPNSDASESADNTIHIQHLSLPLGLMDSKDWEYKNRFTKPLQTVPVYYPTHCRLPAALYAPPQMVHVMSEECAEFMGDKVMQTPTRYFVNITSHIQWYRRLGVEVYPVMVVRDPSFHFKGVLKLHIQRPNVAYHQYLVGREIMLESLQEKPLLVSYETLLTLQKEYLETIYEQLNITSDYVPNFKNGNLKYAPAGNDDTLKYIQSKMKNEEKVYYKRKSGGQMFNVVERLKTQHDEKRKREARNRGFNKGIAERVAARNGQMINVVEQPKKNPISKTSFYNKAAAANAENLRAKLEKLRNQK